MINTTMKTFRHYLAENKKVYSFKIKVAGDLPENFIKDFKTRMDRCGIVTLDETSRTPVQALPIDFPELKNLEVHIIEFVSEYPVTAPELSKELVEMGLSEEHFRVRGSEEPSEMDQAILDQLVGHGLVENPATEVKVKHKDYFGDEFNKGFLKELAKTAKERKKEGTSITEYELPKHKDDKAGTASAIGSK
jgi:hypothetical protein